MKNQIVRGVFFLVPLVSVLSLVCEGVVCNVLIFIGSVAAVLVIVSDVIAKKIFLKRQLVKLFFYAWLGVRFGQIYHSSLVVAVFAPVCCLFLILILGWMACLLEDSLRKVRKLD